MNPTESIANIVTVKFLASLPMISVLWDVFYTAVLFGSLLCNFDCQKINSLILFLYTIASIYLQCLCFYFKVSYASLKIMKILENKD